jgi:hypothetical protein
MACTVGQKRREERKITGGERRVDYCGVAITVEVEEG